MSIRLIRMALGSADIVVVNAALYSRSPTTPCELEFRNDGTVYVNEGIGLTFQYNWLIPGVNAANYDIRATITGGSPGTFSTGTAGSYLNLGTTRSWTRGSTSGVLRSVIATFDIRDAVSLAVVASASITLECEVP